MPLFIRRESRTKTGRDSKTHDEQTLGAEVSEGLDRTDTIRL